MDPKDEAVYSDRMKFVVAIMTKDYAKAIELGTSIIKRQPNDRHVHKCLSALRKIHKVPKYELAALQGTSSVDNETNVPNSSTEESDDANSSSDDTDVPHDCKIESGATLHQKNLPRSKSVKSLAECVRENIMNNAGCTNETFSNFREKMYRVIPLKFTKKK